MRLYCRGTDEETGFVESMEKTMKYLQSVSEKSFLNEPEYLRGRPRGDLFDCAPPYNGAEQKNQAPPGRKRRQIRCGKV